MPLMYLQFEYKLIAVAPYYDLPPVTLDEARSFPGGIGEVSRWLIVGGSGDVHNDHYLYEISLGDLASTQPAADMQFFLSGQTASFPEGTNWTIVNLTEQDIIDYNNRTMSPVDAVDDYFEGTPNSDLTVNLFSNDTIGSDITSIEVYPSDPASGQIMSVSMDGTITYRPATDFSGQDSFSYVIVTSESSDSAVVTIDIVSTNPVLDAVDDFFAARQDRELTLDIFANDDWRNTSSDFHYTYTEPAHGSLQVLGDGTIVYQPDADFTGPDEFTYTLVDGVWSDSAVVEITIDPFVLDTVDDDVIGNANEDLILDLLGNDTLVGVSQNYDIQFSNPTSGSLLFFQDGSIVYRPDVGFVGSDSFTYTITDGPDSGTAIVNITIAEPYPDDGPFRSQDDEDSYNQAVEDAQITATDDYLAQRAVEHAASLSEVSDADLLALDSFTYQRTQAVRDVLEGHSGGISQGLATLSAYPLPAGGGESGHQLRMFADQINAGKLANLDKGLKAVEIVSNIWEAAERLNNGQSVRDVVATTGGKMLVSILSGEVGAVGGAMVVGALGLTGGAAVVVGVGAGLALSYAYESAVGAEVSSAVGRLYDFGADLISPGQDVVQKIAAAGSSPPFANAGAASPPSWWFDPDSGTGKLLDETDPALFELIVSVLEGGGPGVDMKVAGAAGSPFFGTASDDRVKLTGTEGSFYGGGGRDELSGNAGDNLLSGDGGIDTLRGGAGNDTLLGGHQRDTIIGGMGDDVLEGGRGADHLEGSQGRDTASYANAGEGLTVDFIKSSRNSGEATGDTYLNIENIRGSGHDDWLRGDGGRNSLNGMDGDDLLFGAGDNDELSGDNGRDVLNGGTGNDLLQGGTQKDVLIGGAGDDILTGGRAGDILKGGSGRDTASYRDATEGVEVTNWVGLAGDAQGDHYSSIEILEGSGFDDLLTGSGQADEMRGLAGDDFLSGEDGADVLLGGGGVDALGGGLGNDVLVGGSKGDYLFGGLGIDIADYSTSKLGLTLDLTGARPSTGDAAGDSFNGIEIWSGSKFDDLLVAPDGSYLGAGVEPNTNYEMRGAGGNDVLLGRDRSDILKGDSGYDLIQGGSGKDFLWGGAGVDWFVFDVQPIFSSGAPIQTTNNIDYIRDFEPGVDKIVLVGYSYTGRPISDVLNIVQPSGSVGVDPPLRAVIDFDNLYSVDQAIQIYSSDSNFSLSANDFIVLGVDESLNWMY